jgi:NTP pyrophosphatase (non-canonical NTP hydrolase)
MTLNEYQQTAMDTAVFPKTGQNALLYTALGLASEAGEYAGKVKKLLRDAQFSRQDAVSELGDVLWYVAAAADALGVDLAAVADKNIAKLRDRKERGALRGSGDYR